jgi:hypothetical protein
MAWQEEIWEREAAHNVSLSLFLFLILLSAPRFFLVCAWNSIFNPFIAYMHISWIFKGIVWWWRSCFLILSLNIRRRKKGIYHGIINKFITHTTLHVYLHLYLKYSKNENEKARINALLLLLFLQSPVCLTLSTICFMLINMIFLSWCLFSCFY